MVVATREMPFPMTAEEIARFMSRVGKTDDASCWPWTGSKPGKLGCFHLRGRGYKAPRIALMLDTGRPVKNGLVVRQTCGDPNCVNPRHLYAWTKETIMEDRFWEKVDKTPGHGPDGDCWLWTGPIRRRYGSFGIRGRQVGAHRLSLKMAIGDPPNGELFCLHSCDVSTCVNPAHLRWGTHQENMDDMWARGRKKCK